MTLPHETHFRYRRHLFGLALLVILSVMLSFSSNDLAGVASVLLAASASYVVMRMFVSAGGDTMLSFPHIARVWALISFYGAIPLCVIGLYFGSKRVGAPPPDLALVALVTAAALGFAAGASRVFDLLNPKSNNPLEPTR